MPEYTDLAAFVLAQLQATSAVTALVVGGAAGIIEAGLLTGAGLDAAERARQTSGADQVLAVLVVDAGETGPVGQKVAGAQVLAFDRRRGYANIRAAREAIIAAVVDCPVVLTREAFIVQTTYAERSGFLQASDFDVEYETIIFNGLLTYGDSADSYA